MVALIVFAAVYLTPFVWMITTSLKTLPQSIASPPVVIPNPITLKPFTDALTKMNYPLAFRNTLIYAVPAVIGTVVSCSLVAYGFALVQWRGRNTLFLVVLWLVILVYLTQRRAAGSGRAEAPLTSPLATGHAPAEK